MQLGTQRKFEILPVYPIFHLVRGPTRHWFTNGFSLLLHPPPLSPSTQSTHPKTCKLWCQKQFSPLSTSSTFFFHSSSFSAGSRGSADHSKDLFKECRWPRGYNKQSENSLSFHKSPTHPSSNHPSIHLTVDGGVKNK